MRVFQFPGEVTTNPKRETFGITFVLRGGGGGAGACLSGKSYVNAGVGISGTTAGTQS